MASKGNYKTNEEKEEWMGVLKMTIMSSDSSGEDDGEDVLVVHPLPWLSADVSDFKCKLDEEIKKEKSPQARRQMKRRVVGSASSRPCPSDLPSWAIHE